MTYFRYSNKTSFSQHNSNSIQHESDSDDDLFILSFYHSTNLSGIEGFHLASGIWWYKKGHKTRSQTKMS